MKIILVVVWGTFIVSGILLNPAISQVCAGEKLKESNQSGPQAMLGESLRRIRLLEKCRSKGRHESVYELLDKKIPRKFPPPVWLNETGLHSEFQNGAWHESLISVSSDKNSPPNHFEECLASAQSQKKPAASNQNDFYLKESAENDPPDICGLYLDTEENRASKLAGVIGYTNTGQPIEGIKVVLFSKGWKKTLATTFSNSKGFFTFNQTKPGKYYLMYGKKGFMTTKTTIIVTRNAPKAASLLTEACRDPNQHH